MPLGDARQDVSDLAFRAEYVNCQRRRAAVALSMINLSKLLRFVGLEAQVSRLSAPFRSIPETMGRDLEIYANEGARARAVVHIRVDEHPVRRPSRRVLVVTEHLMMVAQPGRSRPRPRVSRPGGSLPATPPPKCR